MKRRSYLALIGASLSGVSGCATFDSDRKRWETTLTDNVVSPLITRKGTTVAATEDGKLHGLDPSDGDGQWSERLQSGFHVGPATTANQTVLGHFDLVWGGPDGDGSWALRSWSETRESGMVTALAGGDRTVYVARNDRTITCFHEEGYARYWDEPVELDPHASTVTAQSNRVIAAPGGGADGVVVALSASDGNRHWEYSFVGISHVATTEERAFVATADGVTALDISDGSDDWHYALSNARTVATAESGLYAVSGTRGDATLTALTADGDYRWDAELEWITAGEFAPVVADGRVYVAEYAERVSAFDADTGDEAWSYDLGDNESARTKPLVHDGTVYVGVSDAVLALDA